MDDLEKNRRGPKKIAGGVFRCLDEIVEASCVFRALMRYEVKQHDFKMFEGDS
jgi:hypothetical protein